MKFNPMAGGNLPTADEVRAEGIESNGLWLVWLGGERKRRCLFSIENENVRVVGLPDHH